jgi:hypothetical protein
MYLLDANTYIQAKNFHYDMDFCPAYWDWLDKQFAAGALGSIKSVYDEIANKGDNLSVWVSTREYQFDAVSDQATQELMRLVAVYVTSLPNMNPANVAQFLSGADPWLIARAIATGKTVVTYEALAPANSKKVKIPNVCQHFGVPCIDTYQLLKLLQAQFVLQ